jgi:hypothetical protein
MMNGARRPFDFALSHKCLRFHFLINNTCKLAPIKVLLVPLTLTAVSSIFYEQKCLPSPLLLLWMINLLEYLVLRIRNFC